MSNKVKVLYFRASTEKLAQCIVTKVLSPVTYSVQVKNQKWRGLIDKIRAKPRTLHREKFYNYFRSSEEILGSECTIDHDELVKSKSRKTVV